MMRTEPLSNQMSIPGTLFFNLLLPVTEVGVGPFKVDLLDRLLGQPLGDILQPALRAPMFRRSRGPSDVNVFPLFLPPGDGVSLGLGILGDIGFTNDGGYLRIIAPASARGWLRERLAPWLVRGPEVVKSLDEKGWVALAWIRLEPGMYSSIPIERLGEVGLEVG